MSTPDVRIVSSGSESVAASVASLQAAAEAAARQIPPLWPLESSVAVNPFLGQAHLTLADTGALLARTAGVRVTLPREWYLQRIGNGEITDEDLAAALAASPHAGRPTDVRALKAACAQPRPAPQRLPTVADLAARSSGIDWPAIIADRIGVWAGGYFDRGQALWSAPRGRSAWFSWRTYATHDLTPEIMGLAGFASLVADLPEHPSEAMAAAAARLNLDQGGTGTYFHQLLLSLGGWAQYARYHLWQAERQGRTDTTITDLLLIRLIWEQALWAQYEPVIAVDWAAVRKAHEAPVLAGQHEVIDEILQEAAERAAQRALAVTLAAPAAAPRSGRPAVQAVFCIDVRSEVVRRALEAVDSSIQTIGFAGFFGIFTKHRGFASDVEEWRLPVLFEPTITSSAGSDADRVADLLARYRARASRAWGRFKLAAVSSFAFVEATGPIYIAKLIRDTLGLNPAPVPNDPAPHFDPQLDIETGVALAETVLRAMSLTDHFARLVLLVGHGANVINNPYASGLHCGACGGYSGEVNARLLARLLNQQPVREGLARRGIVVPEDTLFVAALHDTTTDRFTLYDRDVVTDHHVADLQRLERWLASAGRQTRGERALRLPRAARQQDIHWRARNWAEVRPEWGLAGCKFFIAAPRSCTSGRNLQASAFLHDYDWRSDAERGFGVLELILTAPVVVASWISLQYLGSTVAPEIFGSGNKLLHNVVGGMGVFEGNGGNLRAGLPWQSVHDGHTLVHEPLRLSVCIQAPRDALTAVLQRHPQVRVLFDNRWLHLFALDEQGRLAWRYTGGLQWQPVAADATRS